MSELSPFTFHQVGAPGEPAHYELRDLSGRVVCKACLSGEGVALFMGGCLETRGRLRGYSEAELEALMRAAVRG